MNPNSISRNWNTDENYWILNPVVKTIKDFDLFYKQDKSKNKDKSSKIMWAIALYCDPHDQNPWKNVNDMEKKVLIAEEFLRDKKFDFDHTEIAQLIKTYENKILTVAQQELRRLEKKLAQRGEFIDKTEYSLDTYDEDTGKLVKGTATQLDKMVVDSGKIFEQLIQIQDKLSKEAAEGHLRGGAAESASESGEF